MNRTLSLLAVSLLLTGCAGVNFKGGQAQSGHGVSLVQGDNPSQPSKQTHEATTVETFIAPAGSVLIEDGVRSYEVTEPTPVKRVTTTVTKTELGAAQKNTVAETAAKLKSLRPVQFLGFLLIVGALAMFHPIVRAITRSSTLQMVTGAAGAFLIFAPVVIVGNEGILIAAGIGLPAVWFFVHRHGRLQGLVDANKNGIDDRLEK